MKIGVDLDGVVYDFVDSLREYLVTHCDFPRYDLGESTSWEFFKDNWGMELADFLRHFEDGVNADVVFTHGEPEPYSVDTIALLRDEGHSIHIVTHRELGCSVENTARWLRKHGVKYDTLSFSKDKTVVPVDVFIEDNMGNFTALEQAGVRSVLMNRPWNQDLQTDYRVNNWLEFYEFVKDMKAYGRV